MDDLVDDLVELVGQVELAVAQDNEGELVLWRARKRCEAELLTIARPAWAGIATVWTISLALSLVLVLSAGRGA